MSEQTKKEMIERHFDIDAGRLPKVNGIDIIEEIHLERYRFAKQYVENKIVLDIACGIGYGSHLLGTQGKAKEVTGVDISYEAIENANKTYPSKNISFILTHGEQLPFVDNYFDVIVSYETIEHTTNPLSFLNELSRVITNNGTLIISTPNKRFHSLWKIHPWNPYHMTEFYPTQFREIITKYFPTIEYWGGQEFSKVQLPVIIKHNWTEIKYYKLLHHRINSKFIKPLQAVNKIFRGTFKSTKTENKDRNMYEQRCLVNPWIENQEPYTIIAICKK